MVWDRSVRSSWLCPVAPRSPDDEDRAVRVVDDLVGGRPEDASPDAGMAAVADHEQIGADLGRVLGQRLRRVSGTDLAVTDEAGAGDPFDRLVLYLPVELLGAALLVV